MANYSMNPQNPQNDPATPPPITGPPAQPLGGGQQAMGEPRTIRDYIALARSQGTTPTFTNRDEGAGFDIRQDPSMIPQAIPEEPVDDYESMPFTQRMKINPYMRTKRRLPTMLPELWKQMFGDKQRDEPLSKDEKKAWDDEVQGLTGNLLKQHDKQYNWDRENHAKSKVKRARDEQFWQKFYADKMAQQNPPTDPNTGEPLTVQDFIDQQMSIADERQFREDMAEEEEVQEAKVGTIEDLDAGAVSEILGKNPALAQAVRDEVIAALGQIVGNPNLTDADFNEMRTDPAWSNTFNEEVRKAIMNNQEAIMQFANGKPQAAAAPQESAIPEEPRPIRPPAMSN